LAQITDAAISFLTKEKNKGFFVMLEGGKIDWACHNNDAATAFNEVIDFDNAIKVAYEFYKKHPKETLIVITADHETGGIGLGTGSMDLNLKALQYQKISQEYLSVTINKLRKEKNHKVSWEEVKALLADKMGLWKELPVSWEQEKKLRDEYENSFVKNVQAFEKTEYAISEPLAARAKEVVNEIARVAWASGNHSAGYVPVFAIGAGAELFNGKMDNIEIPKRIAKAGGYK
jgi:alkaline phosphatase